MAPNIETSIRNPVAVREALRNVCERGELLLLVTPYVRFESNFLRLDQDAVWVTASMSREDAIFGLRAPDLRIRFPFGHQFFEAATRLQGLGNVRGRQALGLALPDVMTVDDYRGSYRVERVGRLMATFSSRRYDLLMATVVNLSTTGVRIFAQGDFQEGDVLVDDTIHIALTVTAGVDLNCKAKVRYVKDRVLGLEFRPRPDGPLLDAFARWVFQKQEEESVLRGGIGEEAAPEGGAAQPRALAALVLAGGDAELEGRLRGMFTGLPPLERVPAGTQAMKDLVGARRSLVIFHVPSLAMEDRKRVRILLETLAGKVPFVLLGTGVDNAGLAELAAETKAVAAYNLGPASTGFFPRLVQGILRKHFPG